MKPLTQEFVARLPQSLRERMTEVPRIEEALGSLVERVRLRWSGLALELPLFLAHVADRLPSAAGFDEALASLRVEDLYLACACANEVTGAIAAFEKTYGRHIEAIIGQVIGDPTLREEARQQLREQLFVAPPMSQPKIAEYAGRGDLLAFLRVLAVRAALDLLRKEGAAERTTDNPLELAAHEDDPELQHLKLAYRQEFKEAVAEAIASLAPRQRTLLRYNLVDELSIDQIAAIYRVHRATAARWIAGARQEVRTSTQETLMRRLQIGREELDSVLRLVQSGVDVSIRRLLQRG